MSGFPEVSWAKFNGAEKTLEVINAGSLQRIADAVEKMSGNYDSLIYDRNFYKNGFEERGKKMLHLLASNRSLRGVITKLHRQVDALKGGAR
jgi:hypothetical protein